jgi:hypothetical protein
LVGSYNCPASYLPPNQGLIQEFVADLDFFYLIQPVGDKSFSIALDLARCRFGMPTVHWAHNVHGGEACWGWQGEAVIWRHEHRQSVKWHGGQAWQQARAGDSFPWGWAGAGPRQQAA